MHIDSKLQRSLADRIVRATAKNMAPFGYALTKPKFLCREYPFLIAFFHFHKYSGFTAFRIHCGIRVLNGSSQAQHLNGPNYQGAYRYDETDDSVNRCIQSLSETLINRGLPWIESWLDPNKLISDADSPLSQDEKLDLRTALDTGADPQRVALSYKLFGVKPPDAAPVT